MKRLLKTALAALLTLAMLLASGTAVFADETVDIEKLNASEWMASIPGGAYISALNVPGTHDSGLSLASAGVSAFAQCQKLTITQQLEAGVRFFDIRLRYAGNPKKVGTKDEIKELYVCHGEGAVCCDGYITVKDKDGDSDTVHYTYEMVLDEMATFLEKHPTETIFYFVRNEYLSGDEKKSTSGDAMELNECYKDVLAYDDDIVAKRLAKSPVSEKTGKPQNEFVVLTPDAYDQNYYGDFYGKTMDECRGKLFRFQNEYGFGSMMNEGKFNDWDSSYNDKWNNLKPFFDTAPAQTLFVAKTLKYKNEKDEKSRGNVFRAAWTSCTGMYTYDENGNRTWNNIGIETIDFFDWVNNGKGFPTGGAEAKNMNRLLMDYKFDWGAYYGWIAMDMVTEDLARLIFQTNDFNNTGKVISKKEATYIKDIMGFCDLSYDDAVQLCYEYGYTPLQSRVNDNGKVCFDINPDGYPIVLGYTTTTDKTQAITDIVGRYDSNEPGDYKKVIVKNSLYNYFTRGAGWSTEDTYLFVSRNKSKAPIKELEIMYGTNPGTAAGMVSFDLDDDKPVGSNQAFNLQEGVEIDDKDIFIGLRMIREQAENNFATAFGTGNIIIVITCVAVLVLAVLLMIEKRKTRKLAAKSETLSAMLESKSDDGERFSTVEDLEK